MSEKVDVVVIGAGAAGMMCAIEAGKRGREVLVLDHAKKPGRKILISGGGRCNFTNYDVSAEHFLCANPHFVKSALSQFSNWDFINLVSQYGIDYEERDHGQLFCLDSAKNIVAMLLQECRLPNIHFRYQVDIHDVTQTKSGFHFFANRQSIECQSVVIATGGLSMPKLGATPFGYKVAEQFGLNITPTKAGLVPFTLHKEEKENFAALSGVAVPVVITTEDGVSFKESLLFTHRGLSGPSVLQASSYWKPGQKVMVDWIPNDDIGMMLAQCKEKHPNQTLKNTLANVLPKRVVEVLMEHKQWLDKPLKQYNEKECCTVIDALHHWAIIPNGTEGYRTAEVTLGGVDTDAISSKTMECNSVKGLFFVGEVMDVSGWLGGYNFQWAWSSGWVAGQWV